MLCLGGRVRNSLNLNTLLLLFAGEGTDDAFGSSAREADGQPGFLRGDGAGTNLLLTLFFLFLTEHDGAFSLLRYLQKYVE